MIQLGDTPVISKIIDSYPKKTKFIVITGYKGVHIKEYLRLVYPKRNIKIINVDLFEGPGSGLSYTLSKSLKFINEPFFFHANDTILTDKKFYSNIKKNDEFKKIYCSFIKDIYNHFFPDETFMIFQSLIQINRIICNTNPRTIYKNFTTIRYII